MFRIQSLTPYERFVYYGGCCIPISNDIGMTYYLRIAVSMQSSFTVYLGPSVINVSKDWFPSVAVFPMRFMERPTCPYGDEGRDID
jgi:hypothetical protein